MSRARPYQATLKSDIYAAWAENPRANVLAVAPTGAGKTFTETRRRMSIAQIQRRQREKACSG